MLPAGRRILAFEAVARTQAAVDRILPAWVAHIPLARVVRTLAVGTLAVRTLVGVGRRTPLVAAGHRAPVAAEHTRRAGLQLPFVSVEESNPESSMILVGSQWGRQDIASVLSSHFPPHLASEWRPLS
jgi:hypothetical protein